MRTSIIAAVFSGVITMPAFAPPALAQDDPPQGETAQQPASTPPCRPAKPGKPAPRWMVAAAETSPPYPAYRPRLAKAPPADWRPSRRWALGATVGSDGVGADVQFLATRALVLRARAAYASVDHGQTYDHVHYNGRLRLSNAGGYVDIHLLDGMLHPLMLSLGAVSAVGGRRHVAISATPQSSFNLGGHSYTTAQLGTLTGDVGLDKLAPFAGLGFDNTFDTSGRLGFKLLAGVVFSSDPEVTLTSKGGLLSNSSALQADLKQEEAKIRDAAQYLHYYPAISTGLTYKF